jgi:hypothetical protein
MKKQGAKKLTLHFETLRVLGRSDLRKAAGGGTGEQTTQACDEASWCACASEGCVLDSWQHTCTCW